MKTVSKKSLFHLLPPIAILVCLCIQIWKEDFTHGVYLYYFFSSIGIILCITKLVRLCKLKNEDSKLEIRMIGEVLTYYFDVLLWIPLINYGLPDIVVFVCFALNLMLLIWAQKRRNKSNFLFFRKSNPIYNGVEAMLTIFFFTYSAINIYKIHIS